MERSSVVAAVDEELVEPDLWLLIPMSLLLLPCPYLKTQAFPFGGLVQEAVPRVGPGGRKKERPRSMATAMAVRHPQPTKAEVAAEEELLAVAEAPVLGVGSHLHLQHHLMPPIAHQSCQ